MLRLPCCLLLLLTTPLPAQHLFHGQAPPAYAGQIAHLDIIDGHNDFRLIAESQLLRETRIDSLGYFRFSGQALPGGYRFYRIRYRDPATCPAVCMDFLHRHYVTFFAGREDTVTIGGLAITEASASNERLNRIAYGLDALNAEQAAAESERLQELIDDKKRELLRTHHGDDPAANLFLLGNWPAGTPPLDLLLELEDDLAATDNIAPSYLQSLRAAIGARRIRYFRTEIFWLRGGLLLAVTCLAIGGIFWARSRRCKAKGEKQGTEHPVITPGPELSPKETEILTAIQTGQTNKEIAAALFISEATVKSHINSIYKKTGLRNRRDARKFGAGPANSTGV